MVGDVGELERYITKSQKSSWVCPPSSPGSGQIPWSWYNPSLCHPSSSKASKVPQNGPVSLEGASETEKRFGKERDTSLQGKIYTHCQFIFILTPQSSKGCALGTKIRSAPFREELT